MVSPELTSLQQAYQEMPERWYEHFDSLNRLVKIINLPSTLLYLGLLASGNDSFAYHLIGGGVFITSTIIDRITTARALNAANIARLHGINIEHEEGNPQIPNVTTSREFNYHPRTLLMDFVGTTASFALPNLGVTFSTVKLAASFSNLRIARRYDRATEIAISNLGTNFIQPLTHIN